ncbi:hypothetical protein [Reyranella sp.]|uniref:hypothetical protein n=1 Tax=Reyranella sp. TaxID=1929291 RepID=UPI00261DED00|nr:hypothetical protein [Reyranella sp.]HQS18808.1 hypothetical protein [Reyranella sp.]HQT14883.1 hypothetical protein [Reyranella sp.]
MAAEHPVRTGLPRRPTLAEHHAEVLVAYKYSGLLGRRPADPFPEIDDPSYNPFDPKSRERIEANIRAQFNERVEALFKDCKVDWADPEGWRKVALTLAERHIIAFKGSSKAGRKRTVDFNVIAEMHSIVQEGESIKNAARIVLQRRGRTDQRRAAALETAYARELDGLAQSNKLVEGWARQKLKIN